MPFNGPPISPTLTKSEADILLKLLTLHFAYPLAYPLAGAYFEEIFARTVGGQRETKKLLFDVLLHETGWSLKTYLGQSRSSINIGSTFEVVIQRCDILRDRTLSLSTPPETLGNAIMQRFNQWALKSLSKQGVSDPRAGFLLRNTSETRFVFFQQRYRLHEPAEVEWRWANAEQRSLMGYVEGSLVLRWYRSGAQLFGEYEIPSEAHEFEIGGSRADLDATIEFFRVQRGT